MAVRITVVIIQSAQRDGRFTDLEEQLLTRVMFENNMDAVLVGPVEHMESDGTDALCLSKIPSGTVLLGWLSNADAADRFQQLGMPWRIDGQGQATQLRYRQLTLNESSDSVFTEISNILKNISVRTMQIAVPTSPVKSSTTNSLPTAPKTTAPSPFQRSESSSIEIQPKASASHIPADRDDLDQLVDDLEALDL